MRVRNAMPVPIAGEIVRRAVPILVMSQSSFDMKTLTRDPRRRPTNSPRTVPKTPPTGLKGLWNANGVTPKLADPRPPAEAITPITSAMMRKITARSISRAWSGPNSSRPSCAEDAPRMKKMTAANATIPAAQMNARFAPKTPNELANPRPLEAAPVRTTATHANPTMLIACITVAKRRAHRTYPTPCAVFAGHVGYIG